MVKLEMEVFNTHCAGINISSQYSFNAIGLVTEVFIESGK